MRGAFMLMNLILAACFIIVVPILYVTMKNEVKAKKNIVLGVTLPLAAREDARVQAVCKEYVRRLGWLSLALCLVVVPVLFCTYSSVAVLILCVWLIPTIVLPMVLYGAANRKLMKLKVENKWFSPLGEKARAVVDLTAAVKEPFTVKKTQFILTGMLSLAHLLVCGWLYRTSEDLLFVLSVCGMFAVLVWLCGPACAFLIRRKVETVGSDTDLNIALTRVRREGWYHMWLLMAWSMLALQVLVPLSDSLWMLILVVIVTAVICLAAIAIEFRLRARQQELTARSGQDAYTDEDEYWLFGQFYYNKNDSHIIVNNRVGANTSVNLARPGGAAMMVLSALLIFLMPLLGVWMMGEELSPIECTVTAETLTVSQGMSTYTIETDDITNVEVLEDLPYTSKCWGSNFSNMYKGSFKVEGYGTCEVLLDPTDDEFLLIEADGETYVFSFRGEEDVSALSEQLQ